MLNTFFGLCPFGQSNVFFNKIKWGSKIDCTDRLLTYYTCFLILLILLSKTLDAHENRVTFPDRTVVVSVFPGGKLTAYPQGTGISKIS